MRNNIQYFGDDSSSYYTRSESYFCLHWILMVAATHHSKIQYPSSRIHEPISRRASVTSTFSKSFSQAFISQHIVLYNTSQKEKMKQLKRIWESFMLRLPFGNLSTCMYTHTQHLSREYSYLPCYNSIAIIVCCNSLVTLTVICMTCSKQTSSILFYHRFPNFFNWHILFLPPQEGTENCGKHLSKY